MATFYIETAEGEIYELQATDSISLDYRGTPTKHRMESSDTVTDNYVINNFQATFNGLISQIRAVRPNGNDIDGQKSVPDFMKGIEALRQSKTPFTLHVDDRLDPFPNCVFTNLTYNRTAQTGLGYRVVMGFEQIRTSARARLVEIAESAADAANQLQGKTKGGSNSTVVLEDGVTASKTLWIQAGGGVGSLLSDLSGDN